jgi:hypothetical protein
VDVTGAQLRDHVELADCDSERNPFAVSSFAEFTVRPTGAKDKENLTDLLCGL